MADLPVGLFSDHTLPRPLAGKVAHRWRRLMARLRRTARGGQKIKGAGMLDARQREDIGLPGTAPIGPLERMAMIVMMR
jgi:hypothetical protein